MPNIYEALLESRRMGRDPYGLFCTYEKGRHDGNTAYRATVDGHADLHECILTWEGRKPHISSANMRWHCDCEDFRFTFHPFIKEQGHALMDFPEYIPNGRGVPRAISQYGVCKHLACLLEALIKDRRVKR